MLLNDNFFRAEFFLNPMVLSNSKITRVAPRIVKKEKKARSFLMTGLDSLSAPGMASIAAVWKVPSLFFLESSGGCLLG